MNPSALISALVNSVRIAIPAYLVVYVQVFGWITVSFCQALARLFHCETVFPAEYRVTVSKGCAVLYIVLYLIYFFTPTDAVNVFSAAVQNLTLILSPGLFLCGLRSLRRKASDADRRGRFILYLLFLIFLGFLSPVIPVFFIIVDGIGEIFLENRVLPFP